MSRSLPISDVKARLSECLREAQRGEPIAITRQGRVVGALVSKRDLAQIRRLRAAGPKRGLASLAGGWKGSEGLAAVLQQSRRSRPRKTVLLD